MTLLLLAPSVVAEEPLAPSPLVDVAIGATGDVDALVLFEPAWPGLHAMARCGEALFASEDAPEEVAFAVELTVQPDGRVAGADVSGVSPESAAPSLNSCVHDEALALVLASGERAPEVTATARLRLTRAGSPEPRLFLADEGAQAQRSVLSVMSGGERPPGWGDSGMVGSASVGTDVMAIGALEPDGSSHGAGGLGARGTGRSAGERTPSGEPTGYGGPGSGSGTPVDLTIGEVSLLGMGDQQVFRRVILEHRRELRACLEAALQQSEVSSGRFSLIFVVDPEGAVVSAQISESMSELGGAGDCMTTRVRRWLFPEPRGGGIVRATVVIDVTIEDAEE
ncbi:MAG: hypothetical protein EA398_07085 [Deltaproteobacteria bacterium]|nr:MAG: hypothetical protein EA398_07085 [Deltaproteobacteria bacterium]